MCAANNGKQRGRPWAKGISGNPSGRPKVVVEIRDLARQYGPEAIDRLAALMRGPVPAVAVRAAEILLERGFGRPIQNVEVSGPEAGPIETATFSLEGRLEELARRLGTAIPQGLPRLLPSRVMNGAVTTAPADSPNLPDTDA